MGCRSGVVGVDVGGQAAMVVMRGALRGQCSEGGGREERDLICDRETGGIAGAGGREKFNQMQGESTWAWMEIVFLVCLHFSSISASVEGYGGSGVSLATPCVRDNSVPSWVPG